MATSLPTPTYACPCSTDAPAPSLANNKRASIQPTHTLDLNSEETFNPHSARAPYALHRLDRLLYCEECEAIRCRRCWREEVVYWYCPQCLFEVPTSSVKGDGNRCSRSCYQCPCCTAPLAVTQIPGGAAGQSDDGGGGLLKPPTDGGVGGGSGNEAYTLQCQYCDWSSLEIGVHFNKPTKITEQLAKQRKTLTTSPQSKTEPASSRPTHDELFTSLTTFYKDQLTESSDNPTATAAGGNNPYTSSPYNSPANLARIMSLYGGLSYNALKKSREKPQPMREAMTTSEGQMTYTPSSSNPATETIARMREGGWDSTATTSQRNSAPVNYEARSPTHLWPPATPLRTKRGRRCRTCRHILTRPEQKVGSTRYKIRLLALNHIPRLSIRPLSQPPGPASASTNPAFALRPAEAPERLQPHQTKHFVLTVRNPIFEAVRITLATPSLTPGRVASRVTVLCPSFTVGPAGDVWEEAISASTTSASGTDGGPGGPGGGRKAAMASLTGSSDGTTSSTAGGNADRQPEAGKVWERTRNSTSVILEIVPGSLQPRPSISIVPKTGEELAAEGVGSPGGGEDDNDVLEVPVYVRAEWEVEGKAASEAGGGAGGLGGEKVAKELGYWVVLHVGRIAL